MNYLSGHLADVAQDVWQHVAIVAVSLAIALVVAAPLGVLVARQVRARGAVLAVLGVVYSIPSMALLGVLVLAVGLGFWTAVIAMAAYAQMILVRNISAGLSGVDASVVEAARGSGMSGAQVFWRVEVPLAMPL